MATQGTCLMFMQHISDIAAAFWRWRRHCYYMHLQISGQHIYTHTYLIPPYENHNLTTPRQQITVWWMWKYVYGCVPLKSSTHLSVRRRRSRRSRRGHIQTILRHNRVQRTLAAAAKGTNLNAPKHMCRHKPTNHSLMCVMGVVYGKQRLREEAH